MARMLWMMSIQGGIFIGVVLLVRLLMKKYPKKYSCMLWLMVLARLLCPVFIKSGASLQPDMRQYMKEGGEPERFFQGLDDLTDEAGGQGNDKEQGAIPERSDAKEGGLGQKAQTSGGREGGYAMLEKEPLPSAAPDSPNGFAPSDEERDGKRSTFASRMLWIFYLMGASAAFSIFAFQYLRLKRKTAMAVHAGQEIWLSENIGSPFVFGALKPKIFMPYHIPQEEEGYILRHERMHIQHKDPLLRMISLAALCLHWWNPAVWYAVRKMYQDMEMYCDEAVLAKAKLSEKKEYSATLLHYSMRLSGLSVVLTFGESNTEKRVRNIMKKKKNNLFVMLGFVFIVAICSVLFLTVPKVDAGSDGVSLPIGNSLPESQDAATSPALLPLSGSVKEEDPRKQLEDLVLAFPDPYGVVESKLLPSRMQPGSQIYFVDDTHFIILSGGIYFDTQDKIDAYKERRLQSIEEANKQGHVLVPDDRPAAGDYVDYSADGYAHRIYSGLTLEEAMQRALREESARFFGIRVEREKAPQAGIAEIAVTFLDKDGEMKEISYQYDVKGAGFPAGSVFLLDVNFDGREDILIDLGSGAGQNMQAYSCFLWSEEEQNYVCVPDFERLIRNPKLNAKEREIISMALEDADTYTYRRFAWEGMELVEKDAISLTYTKDRSAVLEAHAWKDGKKTSVFHSEEIVTKWQEVIGRPEEVTDGDFARRELGGRLIYSEAMRNSDTAVLEGTWKITGVAGTAHVYALSEEEQKEFIGKNIVYRNQLHLQCRNEEGTEHYVSRVLEEDESGHWLVCYQNTEAIGISITCSTRREVKAEQFREEYQCSFGELGIDEKSVVRYALEGIGSEIFGMYCCLLDERTMLVMQDGVFFLAEKE